MPARANPALVLSSLSALALIAACGSAPNEPPSAPEPPSTVQQAAAPPKAPPAPPPVPVPEDFPSRFVAAFGDVEGTVALYAPDAVRERMGQPWSRVGIDAIREHTAFVYGMCTIKPNYVAIRAPDVVVVTWEKCTPPPAAPPSYPGALGVARLLTLGPGGRIVRERVFTHFFGFGPPKLVFEKADKLHEALVDDIWEELMVERVKWDLGESRSEFFERASRIAGPRARSAPPLDIWSTPEHTLWLVEHDLHDGTRAGWALHIAGRTLALGYAGFWARRLVKLDPYAEPVWLDRRATPAAEGAGAEKPAGG